MIVDVDEDDEFKNCTREFNCVYFVSVILFCLVAVLSLNDYVVGMFISPSSLLVQFRTFYFESN